MDLSYQIFSTVKADTHFSIQNIPFGVYSHGNQTPKCATRLGDFVIDLSIIEASQLFASKPLFGQLYQSKVAVFNHPFLNEFMSLGRPYWKEARQTLIELFSDESKFDSFKNAVFHLDQCKMHLPCKIGDYTDFYSSYSHAFNVGTIIRGKENAMQPNWFHLPVGYHGRASSVTLSGSDVRRPRGQVKPPTEDNPKFSQVNRLDFELEVAALLGGDSGKINELGHPIKVNEAGKYIFGFVLCNDWSARDVQTWEYVPLGPFGAKNFNTQISPWVITCEALEPFKVELAKQDPQPLPYLVEVISFFKIQQDHSSYDINLDVYIQPENSQPERVCQSNFKYLYWSFKQQLTHHSVTGCNMNVGDMLASGTISGPEKGNYGSMLEISWSGKEAITLSNGEQRTFINDHDTVIMNGYAEKNGFKIGFGEVTGKVLPALPLENYY